MKTLTITLLSIAAVFAAVGQLTLPNHAESVKFAVIGDSGTGDREQIQVGQLMADMRSLFPFTFVIMNGDNMYGRELARDFEKKFEKPYKPLLDAGVKFYASLGNHDDANQTKYKLFNMNGERYYTFKPKDGVRFFALDSTYMDKKQLAWLENELSSSGSEWKIVFFHHPIYSSGGRHGSDLELRAVLEPLFVKHDVSVVFSGHEHFYERLKPQRGIEYFISGSAGKLRKGNIRKTELTAKGFDRDHHFMLVEIKGDQMWFQALSRSGSTIDSGVIARKAGVISREETRSSTPRASSAAAK
jgi:3',5'-cyclic AMP phosphodiesterase CpdA